MRVTRYYVRTQRPSETEFPMPFLYKQSTTQETNIKNYKDPNVEKKEAEQ